MKTYDVVFNDDSSSDRKGFAATVDYCISYIEGNIGTDESYFADYKGGVVSVECNETGKVIYERVIPEAARIGVAILKEGRDESECE